MLKFYLRVAELKKSCIFAKEIKQIEIMTTQEIYTLANETTEAQLNNLVNGFNDKELKEFNTLLKLGDTKELALWTIIAGRYNGQDDSLIYNIAYNS